MDACERIDGERACVNDSPLAADAGNIAIGDRSSPIILLLEKSIRREDKFIRFIHQNPLTLEFFFGKLYIIISIAEKETLRLKSIVFPMRDKRIEKERGRKK